MAQNEFMVSKDGEEKGPFTLDQVVEMVKSQELGVMDYLYDESQEDWVTLLEHEEIQAKIKSVKPKAKPKKSKPQEAEAVSLKQEKPSNDQTAEWYILKGENKFGPFAFHDVIKMLQQKLVFEFDFAWKSGMQAWQRVAEIESFKYENIKELQETLMPDISEVFFRRRHRRVNYNGTLIIHDNKSLWKGQAMEVSAGGAGVVMENASIVPGQKLYLHFKPCDGVPPFNAVCEVVSKKYQDGVKDKTTPIRYGLKFVNISDEAQEALIKYSNAAEAA
tara:strand:- start:34869 stop:35696 length:828 start_codon:yes stop_codon:yes gene_type:complete